jgi:hypothetical protein
VFVGRDRELSTITSALSRLAGSGGIVLVAGEPGIGKTRLAVESTTRARQEGLRTAWGRCWEAGGAPVFWPWREALEACGVVFPDPATIAAGDPTAARFSLFREVAGAMARESARLPIVIVLEDLHAADPSTLLLLEFLGAPLRTMPVLVIGTYRDLEARARPEVGDVLARVGRAGQVLQLARLTAADVADLVRESLPGAGDDLATAIYEITQGNPLFVGEMVREVGARGAGEPLPIPLGVREIIRQRLALVPDETRSLLEAASVLGVEMSQPALARMTHAPAQVLDDAARTGLLAARGDRLRFSHALYREALYHDLPRPRRQALHRDAARALGGLGASLAETGHHLLEGGPEVAAAAIDHAVRASVQAVAVFAFEEAKALLDRARAVIPPDGADLRCRVLIAQAEARIRSGDPSGRELCLEAAQLARALGDASLLALTGLAYGSVLVSLTVDPIMVGMLEESLARLPPDDSALRARTMARLAAARQPAPEHLDRDLGLAFAAVAMARRVGDPRELLAVIHSASGALYGAVEPHLRLPFTREQERLAEELGDTTRLLHARVRLAVDYLEMGDFASYAQLATSYADLAERVGPAAEPWRIPLMRSMLALNRDSFDESLRWQEESGRLEAQSPRARRAQGFHRIGFLRAAERHADLRARLPELTSLWLTMPFGAVLADARVASCLARIGATDELRALLARLPESAFASVLNANALAEALWLTGDPTHAARLHASLLPFRNRHFMYWFDAEIVEGPCTRLLAYLSALQGAWDECDRLFDEALRTVEASGRRSLAARMRFELGDLMVRLHRQPERARALLAEARAAAAQLGLTELVALIDARHPAAALPAARPPTYPRPFELVLEGEYYAVRSSARTLRFKATRGMHYLARLVDTPGVDVHVLDLVGASEADRGDAGELLDAQAFRSYRARLEELRDDAEEARASGDVERAESLRDEMEAIAAELGRATGRGGRAKRADSAVDRARTAVQRRVKDALDRIAEQDPDLGAWLRRAVRTGNYCSFRPTL